MRNTPRIGRSSMVKGVLMAALVAGTIGLLGVDSAHADAKLINATDASPIKDAIQVFRGQARMAFDQDETELPSLRQVKVSSVSSSNLVNAGNGWLLDRQNGRIVNCYWISSGYVGRRNIRCTAADINKVTY